MLIICAGSQLFQWCRQIKVVELPNTPAFDSLTITFFVLICYFALGTEEYCNEHVCLWVCLCAPVSENISGTIRPDFITFSVHATCGRGSVLLRWRSDMFCTSGFVDDVVFFPTVDPVAACRTVRGLSGAESAMHHCLESVMMHDGLCATT